MEWYMYLIAGGVVLVLGALTYLYYRFAKGTGSEMYFSIGAQVLGAIATFLPNDTEKLDISDILLVGAAFAKVLPEWAADPTNANWADCKEEVIAFVDAQRSVIPQLKDLPQASIEQIAEVLYKVASIFV